MVSLRLKDWVLVVVASTLVLATMSVVAQEPGSTSTAAGVDPIYIKFDGIDGESRAVGHEKWIEVDSFSWGLSRGGSFALGGGAGGGASVGKPRFSDFHIAKTLDKATPKLMLACASGEHIRNATMELTLETGERSRTFYKIEFQDVIITSFSQSGSSGDLPMESISFSYRKITMEYTEQRPDGTPGEKQIAGWDLGTNKKV